MRIRSKASSRSSHAEKQSRSAPKYARHGGSQRIQKICGTKPIFCVGDFPPRTAQFQRIGGQLRSVVGESFTYELRLRSCLHGDRAVPNFDRIRSVCRRNNANDFNELRNVHLVSSLVWLRWTSFVCSFQGAHLFAAPLHERLVCTLMLSALTSAGQLTKPWFCPDLGALPHSLAVSICCPLQGVGRRSVCGYSSLVPHCGRHLRRSAPQQASRAIEFDDIAVCAFKRNML